MLQLRLAMQLGTLRQPIREALDMAANLGVEAVELDLRRDVKLDQLSRTAVRQILKWLDDRRLKLCSVRFTTRRGYHETEDLDRRVEATKQAMQKAFELGASLVCNPLTSLPEEGTEAWNVMQQVLFDLSRHGAKAGASLALSTQVSAADIQRLLPETSAGIVFELDPAGVLLAAGKPDEVVTVAGDRIVQLRIRDAVRDQSRRGGVEVQLGRGSVDFPELLGKLEEKQFQGYLLLGRDENEGLAPGDAIQELEQAKEYMQNLWR